MHRKLLILFALLLTSVCAYAQTWSVSGRIAEAGSDIPVTGAVVRIGEDYLWAVSDAEGGFTFRNVQAGKHVMEVSCLGFVSVVMEIDVTKDIEGLDIRLKESSLALDEVVVTALLSIWVKLTLLAGAAATGAARLSSMQKAITRDSRRLFRCFIWVPPFVFC